MVEELSEDTKAALAEQGGMTDDTKPDENSAAQADSETTQGDLPDITIGHQDTGQDTGDTVPNGTVAEGSTAKAGEKDSDLNESISRTLEGAGFTDDIIKARATKDGGLSDEFVQELKAKIDPDLIDAHVGRIRAEIELAKVKESGRIDEVRAKEAALQTMNTHIYDTVGGEDKFKILGETLKSKLSADELAAINVKLASGNKTVVNEALETAVKKYNDIRGMGGKLMEGDAGVGAEVMEHMTKEEYRAVMRSEKYKTDPKYARKIDAERLKTRETDSIRYGHGQYYGYHPEKGRYNL
jgi:hypothetical protein